MELIALEEKVTILESALEDSSSDLLTLQYSNELLRAKITELRKLNRKLHSEEILATTAMYRQIASHYATEEQLKELQEK